MFINISNHPSNTWSKDQINEAIKLGKIIKDWEFPSVDPNSNTETIMAMAEQVERKILRTLYNNKDNNKVEHYILVQGEMTLTYQIINGVRRQSKKLNSIVHVVAATSERIKVETEPGKFKMEFKFNHFRKYYF